MSANDVHDAAPVDGRTARAVRTREAIVDACIELVEEGDYRPTAPRIAERAGVSVRSVFQHFDDLETLFAMVAERVVERVAQLLHPIDSDIDLGERVRLFVAQRALLLEAITPIRRAAAVHAPFSPEIKKRLADGHDFLRLELKQVFSPEIAAEAGSRRQLLDALDSAVGWPSWENLRVVNGRSAEEAGAVVERTIRALLGAGGASRPRG